MQCFFPILTCSPLPHQQKANLSPMQLKPCWLQGDCLSPGASPQAASPVSNRLLLNGSHLHVQQLWACSLIGTEITLCWKLCGGCLHGGLKGNLSTSGWWMALSTLRCQSFGLLPWLWASRPAMGQANPCKLMLSSARIWVTRALPMKPSSKVGWQQGEEPC